MKKLIYAIIFLLIAAAWAIYSFVDRPDYELDFSNSLKNITLNDNGFLYDAPTSASTIEDFLKENNVILGEYDQIIPEKDTSLFSGTNILIRRAAKIKIEADGKTTAGWALEKTVSEAIAENNISLGEDDLVKPTRESLAYDGLTISVTRVEIKEETIAKDIPFKTTESEDNKLSWRTKKITQKGIRGSKDVKYRVVLHNNKEISRKVLEETVTKEPIPEIVTQGTYVKIGKTHTGVASWYAYTGTMAAANPWLPMGSYVRVTNAENGKSVIVKINDRGPFGNGRIIDLDKVAFAKIASIGAGVVNVKMEVIVN